MSKLYLLLFVFIITIDLCVGIHFDCDFVNASGQCRCVGNKLGWEIQCPIGDRHNLTLDIQRLEQFYNRAVLIVQCDLNSPNFDWEIIEGVDLSKDGFRITVFEFEFCNLQPLSDSFHAFFNRININGSDIKKFISNRYLPSLNKVSTSLPHIFLREMSNLEELVLKNNKLENFPDLSNLKRLKFLNLDHSHLVNINISRDAFVNNTEVTEISMTFTGLEAIENDCFPNALIRLNLAFNEISSLTSKSFGNLKNLQVINLDGNPLYNLEADTFKELLELKELSLKYTYFKIFPYLTNLVQLEQLKIVRKYTPRDRAALTATSPLKKSSLKTQIELRNLPNLWNLILQLDLTDFPKFVNLSNLIELDLSENKLKTFPPKCLFHCPKLERLYVRENYLTDITNETFAYLPNLKLLDLSFNSILLNTRNNHSVDISKDHSPFKNNLKLEKLLLRTNRIESISNDWRVSLNHLIELDLRYNNLTHLSAKDLLFTQKNISVFLGGNPITHINMVDLPHYETGSFADPQRRVNLFLSYIPLNCDCQAMYLKKFPYYINIDLDNLVCATPENLKRALLGSIQDKDFRCQIKSECPEDCECWQRPVDSTILIDCSNRNFTTQKSGLLQVHKMGNLRNHVTRTGPNRLGWKLELDLSGNEITELTDNYISAFPPQIKMVNLSDNFLTSLTFLRGLKNNSAIHFSLAKNPFPCEDCLGFQNEYRQFDGQLDVDNMTCISKNQSNLVYQFRDAHLEKLCSIQTNYYFYAIVASLLFISVLIITYLIQEKIKRQREMKEVINLLNGKKIIDDGEMDDDDRCNNPLHFLFDADYEIEKHSFLIGCLIGKGEFGEVYEGLLHRANKTVAFKTARTDRGTEPLKALVSEAKIMMYIGPHEHLVTLLGVYREEINSGILYVAIEFCDFGSLESFLRRNKSSFKECPILNPNSRCTNTEVTISSTSKKQTPDEFKLCNAKSLLKWSEQIASGMGYLGEKNVIHSDLATRNVLLTSEGNAKVTDFGLSRRTYNYTEYVKTAKERLPWRWLAIESLQTNTFSVKSDVWAYGITLWEIFSLGDVPYPGITFNMEFVQELENGLRNFKPKLASDEIYDIMFHCWHLYPEERPTFTSLKIIFDYAVSYGLKSLEEKMSEGRALDDIALEFAAIGYTKI